MKQALIALEDARTFSGESFGESGTTVGEICFNTSMTGYQEVLTDPSYHGQIVTMSYPLIGNYGTNELDNESSEPHVRGFVVGELSPITSNWRAAGSLDEYLKRWKIPAIQGVDTRALTKHLRVRGAMRACLTDEALSPEDAVAWRGAALLYGSSMGRQQAAPGNVSTYGSSIVCAPTRFQNAHVGLKGTLGNAREPPAFTFAGRKRDKAECRQQFRRALKRLPSRRPPTRHLLAPCKIRAFRRCVSLPKLTSSWERDLHSW